MSLGTGLPIKIAPEKPLQIAIAEVIEERIFPVSVCSLAPTSLNVNVTAVYYRQGVEIGRLTRNVTLNPGCCETVQLETHPLADQVKVIAEGGQYRSEASAKVAVAVADSVTTVKFRDRFEIETGKNISFLNHLALLKLYTIKYYVLTVRNGKIDTVINEIFEQYVGGNYIDRAWDNVQIYYISEINETAGEQTLNPLDPPVSRTETFFTFKWSLTRNDLKQWFIRGFGATSPLFSISPNYEQVVGKNIYKGNKIEAYTHLLRFGIAFGTTSASLFGESVTVRGDTGATAKNWVGRGEQKYIHVEPDPPIELISLRESLISNGFPSCVADAIIRKESGVFVVKDNTCIKGKLKLCATLYSNYDDNMISYPLEPYPIYAPQCPSIDELMARNAHLSKYLFEDSWEKFGGPSYPVQEVRREYCLPPYHLGVSVSTIGVTGTVWECETIGDEKRCISRDVSAPIPAEGLAVRAYSAPWVALFRIYRDGRPLSVDEKLRIVQDILKLRGIIGKYDVVVSSAPPPGELCRRIGAAYVDRDLSEIVKKSMRKVNCYLFADSYLRYDNKKIANVPAPGSLRSKDLSVIILPEDIKILYQGRELTSAEKRNFINGMLTAARMMDYVVSLGDIDSATACTSASLVYISECPVAQARYLGRYAVMGDDMRERAIGSYRTGTVVFGVVDVYEVPNYNEIRVASSIPLSKRVVVGECARLRTGQGSNSIAVAIAPGEDVERAVTEICGAFSAFGTCLPLGYITNSCTVGQKMPLSQCLSSGGRIVGVVEYKTGVFSGTENKDPLSYSFTYDPAVCCVGGKVVPHPSPTQSYVPHPSPTQTVQNNITVTVAPSVLTVSPGEQACFAINIEGTTTLARLQYSIGSIVRSTTVQSGQNIICIETPTQPGNYQAVFQIISYDGRTAQATATVTVKQPQQPTDTNMPLAVIDESICRGSQILEGQYRVCELRVGNSLNIKLREINYREVQIVVYGGLGFTVDQALANMVQIDLVDEQGRRYRVVKLPDIEIELILSSAVPIPNPIYFALRVDVTSPDGVPITSKQYIVKIPPPIPPP